MAPGDARPAPHSPQPGNVRRQAMVESLLSHYRSALRERDGLARQALFKEAVYLGIQLEEFAGGC